MKQISADGFGCPAWQQMNGRLSIFFVTLSCFCSIYDHIAYVCDEWFSKFVVVYVIPYNSV